jgi:translation initiation factor eIF-2B subunit epsilon
MAIGVGKSALALGTEPAFRFVLQTLHDQEIVNEEAIFDWAAERKEEGTDTPRGKLFFQKPTQDFLEWLEEESDDESESGDDEDSD